MYLVSKKHLKTAFSLSSFRRFSSISSSSALHHGIKEEARPIALYVHWPYCKSICPYCDFNRYKSPQSNDDIQHDRIAAAYCKEFDFFWDKITQNNTSSNDRLLTSIFIGGGTPSLARPSVISTLLNHVHKKCKVSDVLEVTMESNPTSVEFEKIKEFKAAGVNRLSMGFQSLRPEALKFLGRQHSPHEAIKALETARAAGFERVSIDLIYGRPQQTNQDWKMELKEALDLNTEHISLYQLTMEKGTAMQRRHERGEFMLPDESECADMYETCISLCKDRGLHQYEVSNFARLGSECRHNLHYWRSRCYIGIGPGAHGRLALSPSANSDIIDDERHEFVSQLHPDNWMNQVEERGNGTARHLITNPMERLEEILMSGLRTREGVSRARFRRHAMGREFEQVLPMPSIEALQKQGMLLIDEHGMKTTSRGLQVLDLLLPKICDGMEIFKQ